MQGSGTGGNAPQGLPAATARTAHGAPAYALGAEHRLAQLAMTGTLGGGFFQDAATETDALVRAAQAVDPLFLAQTAVHVHAKGHMRDSAALLLAVLAARDPALFARAFPQVVTSGRMLRNLVQALRSGRAGRRSLGTRPKKMVQDWLNTATDAQLIAAMVGKAPALADVIRMVHPRPDTPARAALFGWIIGKPCDTALLPKSLRDLMAFRSGASQLVPDVPFQMLADLPLTPAQWAHVARNGQWQMLRQGLNMLHRKGAFDRRGAVEHAARLLCDPERIRAAKAMPHQLLASLRALDPAIDPRLRDALEGALEIAVGNVPALPGSVVLCPDVSRSMLVPVTGWRKGATSAVRCIDVAALVAAALLRKTPKARVLPFEEVVRPVTLPRGESIRAHADRLAGLGGGGTNCAAPLLALLAEAECPDLVILISDNQSWVQRYGGGQASAMMEAWERIRTRNPAARLVCIDLQPYGTSQVVDRADVLNIGGFSDAVFDRLADFAAGRMGPDHWVGEIRAITL